MDFEDIRRRVEADLGTDIPSVPIPAIVDALFQGPPMRRCPECGQFVMTCVCVGEPLSEEQLRWSLLKMQYGKWARTLADIRSLPDR